MEFGKKLRVGNFEFLKYSKTVNGKDEKGRRVKASIPYIRMSAISGSFAAEWQAGQPMYLLLDGYEIENRADNMGMLVVTNLMYVGNNLDAEFQVSVLRAAGELIERQEGEVSEEEDKKIVDEERRAAEMREMKNEEL
jgi:hypothetical protein